MVYGDKKRNGKVVRYLVTFFLMVIIGLLIAFAVWLYAAREDKNVYREQGILDYEGGAYAQAVENLQLSLEEQVMFTDALDRDSRMYLADSYFLLQQYDAAIAQYDILLNDDALTVSEKEYLTGQKDLIQGVTAFQNADFATALPAFQMAIENGHTECTLYAGICAEKLGNQDSAVAYLTTYLSYNPDSAYACTWLADYYLQQGRYDTCNQYLQRGLQSSDRSCDEQLRFLEVVYYEYLHDFNTAYELLGSYMQSYPVTEQIQQEYDFLFTRQTLE